MEFEAETMVLFTGRRGSCQAVCPHAIKHHCTCAKKEYLNGIMEQLQVVLLCWLSVPLGLQKAAPAGSWQQQCLVAESFPLFLP